MKNEFYAHGKLLLCGEYVVLDGAWALGLPTIPGQSLRVGPATDTAIGSNELEWISREPDGSVWFTARFSLIDFTILQTSDRDVALSLQKLLTLCRLYNPRFPESDGRPLLAETHLEFPRFWGLGSSSTLIHNLAQWAEVDPYRLLWESFGGSGYDIACAGKNFPLLYRLVDGQPEIRMANFTPSFSRNLHWVYLNQKQDSREGIRSYRAHRTEDPGLVQEISRISLALADEPDHQTFEDLMARHELLISKILGGYPTVKKKWFPDYQGTLKSLGAWGGDFILASGEPDYIADYFTRKGYPTVLKYDALVSLPKGLTTS